MQRRSSNLLALNFILLVSTHLHSLCTIVHDIVASVCNLHILFLEGLEYHQQSMILVSPLFRYLYQIYVLGMGGGLTLILGVRHF